jgi:hypothetical protein
MKIFSIKKIIFIFSVFFFSSFSTAFGASLTKPANNLGLVGYWSFNEATGTVATDFSGRGNSGTLTNISAPASATSGWGNGKLGAGLNFDGSNDWVEVASNSAFGITGDITITAWIKLKATDDYGGILAKGNGTDSWDYEFFICGDSQCTAGSIGIYSSTVGNSFSNRGISDLNWHHVAVIRSGTTVTFYIDGESAGANSYFAAFSNNSYPIRIGTDGPTWNAVSAFNGSIDEVRLYNRGLTATEIRNLYNTGVTKFNSSNNNLIKNGLVGYWTFDGKDTTDKIYDVAGGNNGYLAVGATTSAKTMGKLGQALSFNGTDREVDIADNASLNLSTSFTISAWIKRQGTSWSPIFDSSTSFGWVFQISDTNKITLTDTSVNDYMGTSNVQNGVWQHVVVVKNGNGASNTTFYLNGVADGTASSGTINTPTGIKKIGYDNSFFFNGSIDDVRVYNRALTAAEVKQIYNATSGIKIGATQSTTGGSLDSGLVGYWSFNGIDLTDKVYDKSSQGNNGYYNGRATSTAKIPGKLGQALDFNGTTDYVYLGTPASLFPTSEITLSAWINPDQLANAVQIISNDDGLTISNQMRTQLTGLRCTIGNTTSTQGSTLVVQEWAHVACVYDGANVINYINGVNVGSTAKTGSITYANSNTEPWRIGKRGDAAPNYFDGKIDEARIYNRALTASEIKQLYLMGR